MLLCANGINMQKNNIIFDKATDTKVYPNPTIAEALCEIHFEGGYSQNSDSDSILRLLKEELTADYPSVTEQKLKQYHAAITDMGISIDEEKNNATRLICDQLESLHNIAWDVFSSSLSPKYEALLNGESI